MSKMNYPERAYKLSKREELWVSFLRLLADKEVFPADSSWVDDAIENRADCVKQVKSHGLSFYLRADSVEGIDFTYGETVHLRSSEELVVVGSDLNTAFQVELDEDACTDVAGEARSRARCLLTAVLTELLDDAVGTRGDDFTDEQFAAVGKRVLALRNQLEDPPYMGGVPTSWLDKQVVSNLADACDALNKEK